MSDELPVVKVRAAPEFQRRLGKLAKRYRQIRNDLQQFLSSCRQVNLLAIEFPGIGYTVVKV